MPHNVNPDFGCYIYINIIFDFDLMLVPNKRIMLEYQSIYICFLLNKGIVYICVLKLSVVAANLITKLKLILKLSHGSP